VVIKSGEMLRYKQVAMHTGTSSHRRPDFGDETATDFFFVFETASFSTPVFKSIFVVSPTSLTAAEPTFEAGSAFTLFSEPLGLDGSKSFPRVGDAERSVVKTSDSRTNTDGSRLDIRFLL
jgi:hypothetical protein